MNKFNVQCSLGPNVADAGKECSLTNAADQLVILSHQFDDAINEKDDRIAGMSNQLKAKCEKVCTLESENFDLKRQLSDL